MGNLYFLSSILNIVFIISFLYENESIPYEFITNIQKHQVML